MTNLLYKEECFAIIGACMAAYRNLGSGFLEGVYGEALMKEFDKRNVPYEREKKIELFYDGKKMNKYFRADYVCFGLIIVELKSNFFT